MEFLLSTPAFAAEGTLAVGVWQDAVLGSTAADLDRQSGGAITRAIAASRFTGKARQLLDVIAPNGIAAPRLLLVGMGVASAFDAKAAAELGGAIVGHLRNAGPSSVTIAIDDEGVMGIAAAQAAQVLFGARLAAYSFTRYRTKQKPEEKPSLERVTVAVEKVGEAQRAWDDLNRIADGVWFTRDLVTEPPNVLYPESFADRARSLADVGVQVEVFGLHEMRSLGMGALLGVGQGSAHESRLVVMRWNGVATPRGARPPAPVCIIGKGVTFDTGGISIKPAGGMEDMKYDMAGAGAVVGAMRALAGRKAKAHVVGLIGLTENMPSGTAQRPGDVVTTMSGQTVEVINTDAEGRLVLADVMWYAQDRFKPSAMVDLATLTGAIIVALGHEHAGMFASDDTLATQLAAAGAAVGEPLWRMPLGEGYDKLIASDIADMKNVGGRDGGSISAAQFLQRFTNGVPWAHLDIAGMAWTTKGLPTVPKGATGYGVRLLDRWIADYHEAE